MRAVCRVLAGIAILVGTLMFLQGAMHGNRGDEAAGFIGAILFGAGLLSLTILAASEPRWPDDRARRLGNKKYLDDDSYP